MNERVKDGEDKDTEFTYGEHLGQLARQGDAKAIAELDGPPFPEELRYVHDWLLQLHGRSGLGFGGIAPLSHQEVEAWARLRDVAPEPHEVEALMVLDGVKRNPEAGED